MCESDKRPKGQPLGAVREQLRAVPTLRGEWLRPSVSRAAQGEVTRCFGSEDTGVAHGPEWSICLDLFPSH